MKPFGINEDIVIKVLDIYKAKIENRLAYQLSHSGENLLHSLITRGLKSAVNYLIDNYNVSEISYAENRAGRIPLMVAITRHDMDHTKLWKALVEADNKKLSDVVQCLDNRRVNMLHLAAENHRHDLLTMICFEASLEKKKREMADFVINKIYK